MNKTNDSCSIRYSMKRLWDESRARCIRNGIVLMPFTLIELENEPMWRYSEWRRASRGVGGGAREGGAWMCSSAQSTFPCVPLPPAFFSANSAAAKRSNRSTGSNATTAYYTSTPLFPTPLTHPIPTSPLVEHYLYFFLFRPPPPSPFHPVFPSSSIFLAVLIYRLAYFMCVNYNSFQKMIPVYRDLCH